MATDHIYFVRKKAKHRFRELRLAVLAMEKVVNSLLDFCGYEIPMPRIRCGGNVRDVDSHNRVRLELESLWRLLRRHDASIHFERTRKGLWARDHAR